MGPEITVKYGEGKMFSSYRGSVPVVGDGHLDQPLVDAFEQRGKDNPNMIASILDPRVRQFIEWRHEEREAAAQALGPDWRNYGTFAEVNVPDQPVAAGTTPGFRWKNLTVSVALSSEDNLERARTFQEANTVFLKATAAFEDRCEKRQVSQKIQARFDPETGEVFRDTIQETVKEFR